MAQRLISLIAQQLPSCVRLYARQLICVNPCPVEYEVYSSGVRNLWIEMGKGTEGLNALSVEK